MARPLLITLSLLIAVLQIAAAPPLRPFPQHVRYASGTILPNHRTQAELDEDLRAFYAVWKQKFLREAGQGDDGSKLYRVTFGSRNPDRTVSEGQGYGMVITAWIAGHDPEARRIFDGLWRFSRKHPSRHDPRLMSWEVPPGNKSSAFDGDADIAFGLLLAHAQWGSDGAIDYLNEARLLITSILESTVGPESDLPMLGDWIGKESRRRHNQYTVRPSDFMPAYFRAFSRATGNERWSSVIQTTQRTVTTLQRSYSPRTGLVPDFIVPSSRFDRTPKPAPPHFLEAATDGDYGYNSGRVPWRLGFDAVISGDAVSREQVRRISRWARDATRGDPLRLRGGYHLDGTPVEDREYFTTFFAAPIGVAAMSDASQQKWLNTLYESVRARHEDYYEDSVTLLCMFVMTGNAWVPERLASRRAASHP